LAGLMVGMNLYNNNFLNPYENTNPAGGQEQGGKTAGSKEAEETEKNSFGRKEPGEKCETCEKRKYKDGSDENVSFKAAAHISPEAAAGQVRAHEGEHVANAYTKAEEKGGKVLSVSVRLQTSVCPECGKNYVSGGTTSTRITYPVDDKTDSDGESQEKPGVDSNKKKQGQFQANPYQQNQRTIWANAVRGKNIDYAARPLEEFEMERY